MSSVLFVAAEMINVFLTQRVSASSPGDLAPLNILVMKATKPQYHIWIEITQPLDLLLQSFLTLIERFFYRIWQKFIIYNNSWPLSWPKSVGHCLKLSVLVGSAELSKNSMQDQISGCTHFVWIAINHNYVIGRQTVFCWLMLGFKKIHHYVCARTNRDWRVIRWEANIDRQYIILVSYLGTKPNTNRGFNRNKNVGKHSEIT